MGTWKACSKGLLAAIIAAALFQTGSARDLTPSSKYLSPHIAEHHSAAQRLARSIIEIVRDDDMHMLMIAQVTKHNGRCLIGTPHPPERVRLGRFNDAWFAAVMLHEFFHCVDMQSRIEMPDPLLTEISADLYTILVLRAEGLPNLAQGFAAWRLAGAVGACRHDTGQWLAPAFRVGIDQLRKVPAEELFRLAVRMTPTQQSAAAYGGLRLDAYRLLAGNSALDCEHKPPGWNEVHTDQQIQDEAKRIRDGIARSVTWMNQERPGLDGGGPGWYFDDRIGAPRNSLRSSPGGTF